jgi:hypothetical protein
VEEVHPEVEEAARNVAPVDAHVRLAQVPAARPHEQHRGALDEAVRLARLRGRVRDGAPHGVHEVDLALHHVGPRRRRRVLAVGHEHLRARVERVDDHLAVERTGDLHPSVEQVGRQRRHAPVARAHRRRLREEVEALPRVEGRLPRHTRRKERVDAALIRPHERRHEAQGLVGEHPLLTLYPRPRHRHALHRGHVSKVDHDRETVNNLPGNTIDSQLTNSHNSMSTCQRLTD